MKNTDEISLFTDTCLGEIFNYPANLMDRKNFIIKSIAAAAGVALHSSMHGMNQKSSNRKMVLNSYYFRAQMYTLVPKQVKEDMAWMADAGTNIVSVGILEQDLFAARENVEIICKEASKLNMEVWAVPSRWGGLVAGAPKVPSMFTATHPETWIRNKDNTPFFNPWVSGPVSSIFHPATFEFMINSARKVFETWPISGLIWDEPKSLIADYHAMAMAELGDEPDMIDYIKANVRFYSKLNNQIKASFPDKKTAMFLYSSEEDATVELCAQTEGLDYFGCDGRPWGPSDGGITENQGKYLLDGPGQRFISAAHKNNKKSLWLIENHNLADDDIPVFEKRLPDVLRANPDHLIYYYYPRNLSRPEKVMEIVRRNLLKL
jgi:hypothetical protein